MSEMTICRFWRYWFATVAIFSIATALAAKPVRPAPGSKLPDLVGPSNWGIISQTGRRLTIEGNAQWSAFGELRADGTLYLLWIHLDTGRSAPSVYRLGDGKENLAAGQWGWADEAGLAEDGSLVGAVRADTLYRLVP